MSALDIFFAVVVFSSILTLIALVLTLVVVDGIGYVNNAVANVPTMTPSSFSGNMESTAMFLPTLAGLMVIMMIAASWILSFFIKSHPLGAVYAMVFLILYTIVSLFVSNAMVQVLRLNVFSTVIGSGSLPIFIIVNMPIILIFATLVDIAISVFALRQ